MTGIVDKDQYRITDAPVKRAAKAVTSNTSKSDLLSIMITRAESGLCTIPIDDSAVATLKNISEMDPALVTEFIEGLTKLCPRINVGGVRDFDYDRMIIEASRRLRTFLDSHKDVYTYSVDMLFPCGITEDMKVLKVTEKPVDESDYRGNGNIVYYEDIDLMLINCKAMCGDTMREWLRDPIHVYAGPRCSFPDIFKEDAPLFIPNNINSFSRVFQNKSDFERIIANIESGKEDPSKYLSLKGKVVGCVCLPYPCHCQVYAEVLRYLSCKKE